MLQVLKRCGAAFNSQRWLVIVLIGALLVITAGCGRRGAGAVMAGSPQQAPLAYPAQGQPPLLPAPVRSEHLQGQFVLTAQTPLRAAGNDASAVAAATELAQLLGASFAKAPTVDDSGTGPAVEFIRDPQLKTGAEGYALEIGPERIRVRAADAAGLFYGAVSLWQLATAGGQPALPVALPALRVEDAPRFRWRGFMLDSARHPTSIDEIKRLLDQMARHKLNVFHWHLTDDQGWRLQIKRYPKLTDIGAWRTPAGKAGRDADGNPVRYGGFFTQEQARDIVAYAAQRHITVVPEIELPGHAQAAIASYPELGVTGKRPAVSPDWGVHTWLFNTDDATFTFLENVLTEVMDIFPGQYIHIGGDEADKLQWRGSQAIQAKRKALGLKDDNELQSWFIKRIEKFLVAHDRRLIGWDEILEGGLPEEATVMSWRGTEGAVVAARQGHDVVLSPSDVTYINRMQSEAADEPPGHDFPISLQRIYDFEPVPAQLDAAQAKHVLGTQANLWTEHVRTEPRVEHMVFPRLSALAEVAWSPRETRDWNGFLQRLAPQMQRFSKAGIRAADSAFAVRFDVEQASDSQAKVGLSNQSGFGEIHYTTDGSTPTAQSSVYSAPLQLPMPARVQANAFHQGRALAAPRSQHVDMQVLLTRTAEQLDSCRDKPFIMRLEDDEPVDPATPDGARVAVPVDIVQPCWVWQQAPLAQAQTLRVKFVDLPFNYQFGGDPLTSAQPKPEKTAGELELRQGKDCKGKLLARMLPAQSASAIKTVDIPLKQGNHPQDICLQFAATTRDPLWAITEVQLLPESP